MIENEEIKDLIKSILINDPNKRPTTGEILENKWLTKDGTEQVDLDLSIASLSVGSLLESVDSVSQESDSSESISKVTSSDISDLAAELDEMAAQDKKQLKPSK